MRALIAAGAAAAAWSSPALAPVAPPVCAALRIPRRLPDGARGVALTFDDGPHPQGTPAILELLRAAGARATFFLVGEQVERHPALAREIAAAGHAIALHGHRHRLLLRVAPGALAADLDRGAAAIAEATGAAPALYRPPYGIFSPPALWLVRRRGWRALLWSRWGHDWRRRIAPAAIAREVTENIGDREVLLLHDADHYSAPDSWRRTAAALPLVLETLAERGLATVLP
jgi:peptidoglycan/xylan/chitin deacetylase (PgdA/CDA1 family)